jgi:Tfp pilus assembly protein PilO
VTLTDRDRRIMLILIPIVVLIAYWFLILGPKRDDLKTAQDEQHAAESARDQAVAQAAQLENAKRTFAADYAAVVRLGKAIPDTVDSPSLLVQLDRASNGTHIDFDSVTFGERAAATVPTATTTTSTEGAAQPNGNAAAGGAPAASGLGRASESAGNAVNQGNQASSNVNAASGGTTTTTTDTTTTTATDAGAAPSTTAPSLDQVALTFNFTGSYFDLADFFHRIKRFVYVANNQTLIRGRLLTIDTLSFQPTAASDTGGSSGELTATVGATVYLSPKGQGTTGGATAAGPAGTTTETTTTPAGSQTSNVPLATAGVR